MKRPFVPEHPSGYGKFTRTAEATSVWPDGRLTIAHRKDHRAGRADEDTPSQTEDLDGFRLACGELNVRVEAALAIG
jgi:hypothetical protein